MYCGYNYSGLLTCMWYKIAESVLADRIGKMIVESGATTGMVYL